MMLQYMFQPAAYRQEISHLYSYSFVYKPRHALHFFFLPVLLCTFALLMYKLFPYFNNQNLLRLLSKYPASAGLSQRWHWKTQSCLAFSPAFSLPSFYYKSLCENMGDQTWKSIKLNSNLFMLVFSLIIISVW